MKQLLFSILLASAAAVASAADSPVTGTWKIHNSIAGNENDMTCTLAQKESELTGSCQTDQGAVNIAGKVDGKKVNWSFKIDYNGSPLTLTFVASVDAADKFAGTVTVEEYSIDGEFTATLSK
jgi:hypothetical protein